eukprot:2631159-Alexandrium_andersonii.AAC.1
MGTVRGLHHVPVPRVDALSCQSASHLQAGGLRAVRLRQGPDGRKRGLGGLGHLLEPFLVEGGGSGPRIRSRHEGGGARYRLGCPH